jgi:nicotinate phosphoribosyltransferase
VDLGAARDLVASGLRSLPWEGLMLSHGDPAIPTTQIPARRQSIDPQE